MMSVLQRPLPVKIFISVLSSRWSSFWPRIKDRLEDRLGPLDLVSELILFTQTSYYDQELGTPISRRLLSFANLVDPSDLVGIKLFTNSMEDEYRMQDRRIFNLDPGLLSLERLVLATGKNYTHRIYLREGVWADLTLIFQDKTWQSLPWTYPDYAGTEIQDFLTRMRQHYKKQLSKLSTKDKS